MSIIAWLIVGLIAGALARAIVPGRQSMGIVATMLLGIGGSLVGGFIGHLVAGGRGGFSDFTPAGLIGSILGAIAILLVVGGIGHRGTRRAAV